MPVNQYKLRNFRKKFSTVTDFFSYNDYLFSNYLYDQNKGKTHDFIHTNKGSEDDVCRLISDVEICMSNDPSVTSYYPSEYRQSLLNAIKGMGSKSQFSGLSDDQILESGVRCSDSRELDENYSSAVSMVSSLPQPDQSQPDQPQPDQPQPFQPQSEHPKTE